MLWRRVSRTWSSLGMSCLLSGESACRAMRWCCQDRTHQVMGSSSSSCPIQVWYSSHRRTVPEKGDCAAAAQHRGDRSVHASTRDTEALRSAAVCRSAAHNLAYLLSTGPVNQAGCVHPRGQHRQQPAHGCELCQCKAAWGLVCVCVLCECCCDV